MSGSEHARPVWLTEAEMMLLPMWVRQEWINSPAHPDMAILSVLMAELSYDQRCERTAEAVLRALGHPKEPA